MKVAIIGAGACGLVLASCLEKANIEYVIFEKSLPGRKLLASGNGKANVANKNVCLKAYHNNEFAYNLVINYYEKLMNYFNTINLYLKHDNEGRYYPITESSQSVLDCIGINEKNIISNFNVESIDKINGKYYINTIRGPFDKVVLASGSIASFIKKKQDGFNGYLESLGISFNCFPSLVGFKCEGNLKRLFGLRVKGIAKLYQNNDLVYSEAGEINFKADGISGICILNLSSYYAHLKNKENCYLSIDLIPGIDINITNHTQLNGLVHPKLVGYFSDKKIDVINSCLHDFKLKITGVYDFEFAQVVSGGINIKDINDDLSLKIDNNIFAGGEILDVDGICGGYNLMFAFICGLKLGETLCNM